MLRINTASKTKTAKPTKGPANFEQNAPAIVPIKIIIIHKNPFAPFRAINTKEHKISIAKGIINLCDNM